MVGKNKTDFRPNLSNKALEPLFVQKVDNHQLIPCYKRSHTKELLVRAKKATTHTVQPVENKHNWIEHNQKFSSQTCCWSCCNVKNEHFISLFHSKHPSEATKSSLRLKRGTFPSITLPPLPPPPFASTLQRRFRTIAVKSSWKIVFFLQSSFFSFFQLGISCVSVEPWLCTNITVSASRVCWHDLHSRISPDCIPLFLIHPV